MQSAVSRVCQMGGAWSGTQLVCAAQACLIMRSGSTQAVVVPSALCSLESVPVGTTCHWICEAGAIPRIGAEGPRKCLPSGIFDGEGLLCAATCGPLSHPDIYATATSSCEPLAGITCPLECARGRRGAPTAQCTSQGIWQYSGSCDSYCDPTADHPSLYVAPTSACDNTVGSRCPLFCDPGYVGSPMAYCLAQGLWQFSGTCTAVDCGPPAHPDPLAMPHGCETQHGGNCPVMCADGTTGTVGAVCGADASWKYSGHCNPKSCGPLRHPAGVLASQPLPCAGRPGEVCVLMCIDGYFGEVSATCQADGSWLYHGMCRQVDCGQPEHPDPHANLPDSAAGYVCSTMYPSSCLLSCGGGFRGSPSAQCTSLGNWQYSGTCSLQSCGPLVFPSPNVFRVGDVCGDHLGASCAFACEPGYEPFPELPSSFCKPNGQWHHVGGCQPLQCPPVPIPQFTQPNAACSAHQGTQCRLLCVPGYAGNVIASCTLAGQWQISGQCALVDCFSPDHPSGPLVVTTECSTQYSQTCSMACVGGYMGSPAAVCTADGQWIYQGSCTPAPCHGPMQHPSQRASGLCPQHHSAEPCLLGCAVGYHGSPTAQCLPSGKWQYGGECLPQTCGAMDLSSMQPMPTAPDSCLGHVVGETMPCPLQCPSGSFGNPQAACSLEGQWIISGVCAPVQCGQMDHPSLNELDPSTVANCELAFGGICNLLCAPGLTGAPTATCLLDGQWAYTGLCTLASCPSMVHPDPSARPGPDACIATLGSTCTLMCIPGTIGKPQAFCQGSGEWAYSGTCSIRDCGSPSHPNHDHVQYTVCQSTLYGASCDLRCAQGYTGEPSAVCTVDGTWSYMGSCLLAGCGPVRHPSLHSDSIMCSDTQPGSVCTLQCGEHYIGHPTASCSSDGQWSYSGDCSPVGCGAPSHPDPKADLATVACNPPSEHDPVQKCALACVPGYLGKLGADCVLLEGQDALWQYTGFCQRQDCGPLDHPDLASIDASLCTSSKSGAPCDLLCLKGFSGTPVATCSPSGWMYSGSCLPLNCGTPNHPSPNTAPAHSCMASVGSNCQMFCHPGYIGAPEATCQADGQWSYLGGCHPIDCGPLQHPSSEVEVGHCPNSLFGTVCTLRCSSSSAGSPTAVCTPSGKWQYDGTCSPLDCGTPNHPSLDPNDPLPSCNHTFPSRCEMVCGEGFTGRPLASCQADGNWLYDGTCKLVDCGVMQHPWSGLLASSDQDCKTVAGSVCPLKCATGYIGSPVATCAKDGWWTYEGTCAPIDCGPVAHPDPGVVGSCITVYGFDCSLSCSPGTSGAPTATCSEAASWQYTGTCDVINCGPVGHPSPAVEVLDCPAIYLSTCTLQCAEGSFGQPTASCTALGRWQYSGKCTTPDCGPPSHPAGAPKISTANCLSTLHGQQCGLECHPGYYGAPTASCSTSGTWIYSGTCRPVDCGAPSHPSPQVCHPNPAQLLLTNFKACLHFCVAGFQCHMFYSVWSCLPDEL